MLELAGRGVGVRDLLHDVAVGLRALQPLQTRVDPTPSGGDEVDQKGEVVDTRMPLGEQIALEPLETADGGVHEPPDLGDVARDGENLDAKAVADSGTDVLGDRGLELGRRRCERLDLAPGALESGLDRSRVGTTRGRVRNSLLRSLEGLSVHRHEATLTAGWIRLSSSTNSRPS